jgi:asparagine synthase (glutamine-hydrolysing)
MCGIAGIVASDCLSPDAGIRAMRMRDVLVHRGPDDAGLHCDGVAALAHRRLSIVDLGGGQQPMSNEDGSVWIVFNGEIFNHADVRRDLERAGHAYKTHSDTETIVHAYEQWGDDCVARLRGMFAFAIWDRPKKRLLLARDRLGIKPLYWARAGERLLFGSEIKAILESGLIEPEPLLALIPELLGARYTSGAETLFKGVYKLLPGHRLVFEDGAIEIEQYWDLPTRGSAPAVVSGRDAVERFRELFTESVRLRLMSDVPIGMLLSGGLDSSAVAAIMARLLGRKLQTFSVAFHDRAFNELEHAREVARVVGAESHEVVIDDRDFFSALPRLMWHEDEPIAHPSSVPLYFVSKLARQHVTVVLTGEGSDELLAGYGKYSRASWNWRAGLQYERIVPRRLRRAVARRVAPARFERLARYAKRSFLAMDRTPQAMVFDNFASISVADQQALLAPALRPLATVDRAYAPSTAYFDHPGAESTLLDRLLYADVKTYLVELLMKQDQMSMAASIESRVPFLDHKLVEFCASLPDEWKLSGWTTKRVLREAMKPLLPERILNRPKMGFPVPFASWTSKAWHPAMCDVLLDRRTRERGILDPVAVERALRDHAAGGSKRGDWIWGLLNLELWFRTAIDKQGIQTLPGPARAHSHAHSLAQV